MIEINNLTKIYQNGYIALDDLSLVLPDNGIICVTGESGCGKTTLLNCIYGNITYKGSIRIDLKHNFNKKQVAMVYQDFQLLDNLTVERNLKIAKECVDEKLSDKELLCILQKVGLNEKHIKRKCKNLSGGEKQRVAIARAIVQNASIILADEPTGSLDNKNAKAIFELFKQLSSELLIVVVTHSERLANEYGDHKIVLDGGKIISNSLSQSLVVSKREGEPVDFSANITTKYNSFSRKTICDIIRLPYKSKGVLIVLSFFLVIFMLISCLLGSVISMSGNSILKNNARIKQECIIQVSNNATLITQSAKNLAYFDKVYFGFENKEFLSRNVEEYDDYFLDADFLKFNDDFKLAIFIECNNIMEVGGKLLSGRDVKAYNEIVINESLAYYYLCAGEYCGKIINSYDDLLGSEIGGFVIVGVLSANFNMYNGKYKNITRREFEQLSEDNQKEILTIKDMQNNNGNKSYIVKEGYSIFSRSSTFSLNPHVKDLVGDSIEDEMEIFDSINFSSKSQIEEIIKTFKKELVDKNKDNKDDLILISSSFSNGIESIDVFMDSFGVILYAMFAIFVISTMIYCCTLVYILIKRSNKEFMILNNLGISKNIILKYKTISMLIIGALAILITSILYALVVFVINMIMKNIAKIVFNMFFFNIVVFVCIMTLFIIMLVLGSIMTNIHLMKSGYRKKRVCL